MWKILMWKSKLQVEGKSIEQEKTITYSFNFYNLNIGLNPKVLDVNEQNLIKTKPQSRVSAKSLIMTSMILKVKTLSDLEEILMITIMAVSQMITLKKHLKSTQKPLVGSLSLLTQLATSSNLSPESLELSRKHPLD